MNYIILKKYFEKENGDYKIIWKYIINNLIKKNNDLVY